MAIEIERKFLVIPANLPRLPSPERLEQGYLSREPVVRVRLAEHPDGTSHAFLTLKFKGGVARPEYEYEIPPDDARELLARCERKLSKLRHRVGRWEIDRFLTQDLWLAEIELVKANEPFERPPWLGEEVTDDPQFANVNLAVKV